MNRKAIVMCKDWIIHWSSQNILTSVDSDEHVQPPRSLVSAFVIRLLKSIAFHKQNFNFLASLCSQGDWLESRFLETPKTGSVVPKPML